ncbi:hypothetical protein CsatA_015314 [Cannabis sativa]
MFFSLICSLIKYYIYIHTKQYNVHDERCFLTDRKRWILILINRNTINSTILPSQKLSGTHAYTTKSIRPRLLVEIYIFII